MTAEEKLHIEEKVVEMIKTVYDPEIPIDVYSLGLIYKIDLADDVLKRLVIFPSFKGAN